MDFFNSLSEVAKNRHNFKKWEEQQHHNQAQREELAKRRQHTEAELKQAKELGETIIDVVDIMDNHSENVAENVETAVDPLSAIATLTTLFGGTWFVGKHSTNPLTDKIDKIKKDSLESTEAKNLAKRIEEFKQRTNAKRPYFSTWELQYKSEIQRIKDPSLKKEAMNFYNKVKKEVKPLQKKIFKNHGLVVLGSIGAFILTTIFEAKLQTDSSKIARYQARKELEDAKSFVNYTPEQIAAAKKEMAEHPELLKKEKKSKLKSGMFRSIYGIIKDRRAYKRDKSAMTDDSQKVTRKLSAEEIKNAKKDKEVIQRTVRLINNEAEKYSENMEVAANVIMGATPVLGATIGAGTGWILNKTGVLDRFINKVVEKHGSEETKELFKNLKNTKKTGFSYLAQWGEFAGSLMKGKKADADAAGELGSEAARQGAKTAAKGKKKFGEMINKLFAVGFTNKWGKSGILGLFGGVFAGFAGMMIGLKLQKASARAGRFTAKRELEKNPQNFIGYTEEDYNEVKDIKNNKKKPNKFKEYALFIPTVIKQYWAYNKYKKTEYKEKQVLNDLLKKQEVTDRQLRDAKNLQRKVFNTFEKVDDNSQVYSESMEAATQIAQPFVWYGGMAVAASPFIATGVQVARGKLSPAKLTQKITNILSSSSNIMKKKWFKKYLTNVSKNVTTTVNNVNVKAKPLGTILKDVDFQNDAIVDIIGKAFKNARAGVSDFRKLNDKQQMDLLHHIQYRIDRMMDNPVANIDKEKSSTITRFIYQLKYGQYGETITPETRADVLDLLINPKNLEKAGAERLEKARNIIDNSFGYGTTEKLLSFSQITEKASEFAKNIDFEPVVTKIAEIINKNSGENFIPLNKEMIIKIEKILGKENFEKLLSDSSRLNIQDYMNSKAGIAKPEEMAKFVGIELSDAKNVMNAIVTKAKQATFKDVYAMFPDRYTNPKKFLSELKISVSKMSNEDFSEIAENFRFRSMDKKTFLEILPKVEKIMDNVPKEEMDKIWSQIIKEFQEHPDEFLKLVQDGKLGSIFFTPGLKKALAIAGISWTTFTIAMTYAVEAWMADMQLKAGRLGVMKAMEALDDPAYYANIEPTETADKPQNQTPVKPQANLTNANNSSLLAKFKQVS